MGCDAHMYVEYKNKKRTDNYWSGFGGRINPGRNYKLFGLISKGVRCEFEESFEAKGMPTDAGFEANGDNRLYITSDGNGEGETTLEKAKSWESNGCEIIYLNEKPTWVTHPDWHSHTWLTVDEFEQAISNYKATETYNIPEYEALLAAMKKLAEYDNDVRVIVWFDN